MSDWTSAASGLLGAVIGFVGSFLVGNRTVEAQRRKDNFHIKKTDLEARMKAWGVNYASDSLASVKTYERTQDGNTLLLEFAHQIANICNRMADTPWVRSQQARVVEERLKHAVADINIWELKQEVARASGKPVDNDPDKYAKLLDDLCDRLAEMRSLAESELGELSNEYNALIEQGIPK